MEENKNNKNNFINILFIIMKIVLISYFAFYLINLIKTDYAKDNKISIFVLLMVGFILFIIITIGFGFRLNIKSKNKMGLDNQPYRTYSNQISDLKMLNEILKERGFKTKKFNYEDFYNFYNLNPKNIDFSFNLRYLYNTDRGKIYTNYRSTYTNINDIPESLKDEYYINKHVNENMDNLNESLKKSKPNNPYSYLYSSDIDNNNNNNLNKHKLKFK